MVIGNGMVAKRFDSYQNDTKFLIFASGVSNSKTRNADAYDREKNLLKSEIEKNQEKVLVYFSTCSFYDPEEKNSLYVLHKQEIESLIQSHCRGYHIFRVSNLVGKSNNPNTVLNFFVYHVVNQINFDLWRGAVRNLIDIDDMYKIVDYILKQRVFLNQVINIANPFSYKVGQVVTTIENLWKTQANYISIPKGSEFTIDTSVIAPIIRKLDIQFSENYLLHLLEKYYRDK